MAELDGLRQAFEQRPDLRRKAFWSGRRPGGAAGPLPAEDVPVWLARELGYRPGAEAFQEISRAEAEDLLAFLINGSMAYPASPRRAERQVAHQALSDLGQKFRFFSNGEWFRHQSAGHGWTPITSATFDTGLIGFDRDLAFILWVEEEA